MNTTTKYQIEISILEPMGTKPTDYRFEIEGHHELNPIHEWDDSLIALSSRGYCPRAAGVKRAVRKKLVERTARRISESVMESVMESISAGDTKNGHPI